MGLRLADPLIGLSAIGDLGRGREPGQAARTCFIGCRLARSLGADDETVRDVFYAALLQHVGCIAHAHDTRVLDGGRNIAVNAAADETNFSRPAEILTKFLAELSQDAGLLARLGLMLPARRMAGVVARTSCEVAESTARRIGLPEGVQAAVRHMTEWYNGKGGFLGSKGEEIPLPARILPAAFIASLFDTLAGADAAISAIRARSGSIIDPAVRDTFVRTGAIILAELNTLDLLRRLPEEEPERALEVPADRIDEVAITFGEAVDLKAPSTHGAARRAFELARTAASALSFEATDVAVTGRAAALRDIGKAAIPSNVLEKPGTLTEIEWEAVRLHAYHSERVLSRSQSLTSEATLAGLHHERTDGSGYHRGITVSAIPIAAQVIAITDELVAMTQPRPYRPAISLDHACREIERQSRAHKFDPQVARAVTAAAHGTSDRFRRTAPAGLSDRQIEVLRLIAEGLTNRQIAERLVVSTRTAEHHVQDIYLKIGTSSRAAAALFAVEHQLL